MRDGGVFFFLSLFLLYSLGGPLCVFLIYYGLPRGAFLVVNISFVLLPIKKNPPSLETSNILLEKEYHF